MSIDRFVRFSDTWPAQLEVEQVLENYFSGAAKIHWNDGQNRFYVTLPGVGKFPFNHIFGRQYPRPDRWIEVYVDVDQFSVITREQDEYTNVLAAGLAKLFARGWDGHVDDGSGRVELDHLEAKIVRKCIQLLSRTDADKELVERLHAKLR